MSIKVDKISKTYGAQKALDQVSFAIAKGEIVGFLGPNGAGKSTMMKILTGYIPPSEGQAEVCGLPLGEDSLAIAKKIGYLPEHNPLYLDMYVKEYLQFNAGLHHSSPERVTEIIEKVGLGPESHKKLGQLSKGYRQRAGLAAALLHEPEVLILDEPTTGLDVNQLVEIRNLIKEAGREKTVMLSTHIMQEVELLCDRVIIINEGKIVADRPIAELKAAQQGPKLFVEFDRPLSKTDLRQIKGLRRLEAESERGWLLEGERQGDFREAIFDWARAREIKVLEMTKREEKLEEVFKRLTAKAQN